MNILTYISRKVCTMLNSANSSAAIQSISSLGTVRTETTWKVPKLGPRVVYQNDGPVKNKNKRALLNSTIHKDYALTTAWVEARLIKTGFNTRKTTKKGVRRMRQSLRTRGYMQSNAVVIYPGTLASTIDVKNLPDAVNDVPEATEGLILTKADYRKGIRFMCADGMHRVRCVTELAEEKKDGAQDILCDDMVYAIILRPDTPRHLLIQMSLSKYLLLFTP